jgi:pimeloyl-ACP methyl ester carboxylesterase
MRIGMLRSHVQCHYCIDGLRRTVAAAINPAYDAASERNPISFHQTAYRTSNTCTRRTCSCRRWFAATTAAVTTKKTTIQETDIVTSGPWELPITIYSTTVATTADRQIGNDEHVDSNNIADDNRCPILLISGWTGIASDWGVIPKLLSAHTGQDVITYDPRWLGGTRLTPATDGTSFTSQTLSTADELVWDDMTMDALNVLRHLNRHRYRDKENPYCIVGASMGGIVAQRMLQQEVVPVDADNDAAAIDIQSLVLISTTSSSIDNKYPVSTDFLGIFEDDSSSSSSSSSANDDNTISRDAANQFFESLGTDFLAKPGRTKLRDRLVDSFRASRNKVGIEKQRRLMEPSRLSTIIEFPNNDSSSLPPTLVLHGKQDQVIDYRSTFALQDAFGSQCEVHLYDKSDHLLWITDGMRLVDDISSFCNRQQAQESRANALHADEEEAIF